MKTIINSTVIVCLVLLLSGCIAKRGMLSDNTYYSNSYPDIQIEVDTDFEYTKGGVNQFDHQFRDKQSGRYLFFERRNPKANATQVDYYNHPSTWIYYGIETDTIAEKGEVEVLGKTWYFANSLERKSNGCTVTKNLRRFASDNGVFSLRYIQWYPKSKCSVWEHAQYNSEKDVFFEKFEESFKQAAKITKYSGS